VGPVGPDTGKHLRNIAIIVALALIVWLVPGGARASLTVSNVLGLIFAAGFVFFGYRFYMEHRDSILGLEERQRAILYGAIALALFAIVATTRLWRDLALLGGMLWMLMLGAAGWAIYSVWRNYKTY